MFAREENKELTNQLQTYINKTEEYAAAKVFSYAQINKEELHRYYQYCMDIESDFFDVIQKFTAEGDFSEISYIQLFELSRKLNNFRAFQVVMEKFLYEAQKEQEKNVYKKETATFGLFQMASFYCSSSHFIKDQTQQDNISTYFANQLLGALGADPNYSHPDAKNNSALHYSAIQGYIKLATVLIKQGIDVDKKNDFGMSPLHSAVHVNEYPCLPIIKLLIESGADINAKNQHGWTPSFIAAALGHAKAVKMLVAHHADINTLNDEKHTPLTIAIINGHSDIAFDLIKSNAKVNTNDHSESSPLYIALCPEKFKATIDKRYELVRLLLKHNANPNQKIRIKKAIVTPFILSILQGKKKFIDLILENKLNKVDLAMKINIQYILDVIQKEALTNLQKGRIIYFLHAKDLAYFQKNSIDDYFETVGEHVYFKGDKDFTALLKETLKHDIVDKDGHSIQITLGDLAWLIGNLPLMEMFPNFSLDIEEEQEENQSLINESKITHTEKEIDKKIQETAFEFLLKTMDITYIQEKNKTIFESKNSEVLQLLKTIASLSSYKTIGPSKNSKESPYTLTFKIGINAIFSNNKLKDNLIQACIDRQQKKQKDNSPQPSNMNLNDAIKTNKTSIVLAKQEQEYWIRKLSCAFASAPEIKITWRSNEQYFVIEFPEDHCWSIRSFKATHASTVTYQLTQQTLENIKDRALRFLQKNTGIKTIENQPNQWVISPQQTILQESNFGDLHDDVYNEIINPKNQNNLLPQTTPKEENKINLNPRINKQKPPKIALHHEITSAENQVTEALTLKYKKNSAAKWKEDLLGFIKKIMHLAMGGDDYFSKLQEVYVKCNTHKMALKINYKANSSLKTAHGPLDTQEIFLALCKAFNETKPYLNKLIMKRNTDGFLILIFKFSPDDLDSSLHLLRQCQRSFSGQLKALQEAKFMPEKTPPSIQLHPIKDLFFEQNKSIKKEKSGNQNKNKIFLVGRLSGNNLQHYIQKLQQTLPATGKFNSGTESHFFAFLFYSLGLLQACAEFKLCPLPEDVFYYLQTVIQNQALKLSVDEFHAVIIELINGMTIEDATNNHMFLFANERLYSRIILQSHFYLAIEKMNSLMTSYSQKIKSHTLMHAHSEKQSLIETCKIYLDMLHATKMQKTNDIYQAAIIMLHCIIGESDKTAPFAAVYDALHDNVVESLDTLLPRLLSLIAKTANNNVHHSTANLCVRHL